MCLVNFLIKVNLLKAISEKKFYCLEYHLLSLVTFELQIIYDSLKLYNLDRQFSRDLYA